MRSFPVRSGFVICWSALGIVGCKDKGGTDSASAAVVSDCGDPCALADDQNFSYTSAMDADVIDAKAEADIEIEWSGLTTDILGHAIDPATDITEVRLVVFGDLTPQEVLDGLPPESLPQTAVSGYFTCTPVGTSCMLSTFQLLGSNPDVPQYFTEGSGSWMFLFDTAGVTGAHALVFANPLDASDNTVVSVDNDTSHLTFSVDLTSAAAVGVAAGTTPKLDWSGISVDGLGNPLDLDKIDLLQVAHYGMSLSDMEDSFFDLPTLAEETWSLDVEGLTSASLADLTGDVPFTGIDDTGTWELALWCTSCQNPVPKVLTHLSLPTAP